MSSMIQGFGNIKGSGIITVGPPPNNFVAVPFFSNEAAYSLDGTTWSQTTIPTSNNWGAVAYGSGRYVTVETRDAGPGTPAGNAAAISGDGITWFRTTMPINAVWSAITYGANGFAAVYNANATGYFGCQSVALSPDGVTWTDNPLPPAAIADQWRASEIAYGNGIYLGVAWFNTNVIRSSDGVTWTYNSTNIGGDYIRGLAYGNGLFVAVTAYQGFLSSPDGIDWTSHMAPSVEWGAIAYGNGVFVATGYQASYAPTDIAATSPDGINWIASTLPETGFWQSVAYSNNTFVALNTSSDVAAYSTDNGATWLASAALPNTGIYNRYNAVAGRT